MWMWIVGIVLVVIAGILLLVRRSQASKLAQVLSTETSSCAQVAELCASMEGVVGAETSQLVEVKGTIEPRGELLQAEITGQECVCYRSRVERQWEEERWEKDSQGKRVRRTRRGSDTLAQNERLDPFLVNDGTGQVLVDPEGAKIDWVESVDRFERGEPEGATLSVGRFSLNLGGFRLGSGRRTLGYRYKEWVLPAQHPIYVLGGAAPGGEQPCVRRPAEKGQKFIVSVKSEEEIVKGARRSILCLTIGAAVAGLAGIVLIVLGLAKG